MSADIWFIHEREHLLKLIKLGHERNARLVADNDQMRNKLATLERDYHLFEIGPDSEGRMRAYLHKMSENLRGDPEPSSQPKPWDEGGRDEWFEKLNKDAMDKADAKLLKACSEAEFVEYDGRQLITDAGDNHSTPISEAELERRALKKQIDQLEGKE